MLKNVKKINNYLNNWLKKNGFDCTAQMDSNFNFDLINDVIHYSLVIPTDHDELFLQVCQECREEIENVDNFILSFFHELGHFQTKDMFEDDEWDTYNDLCEDMVDDNKYEDEDYLAYYHYPIELEATQWGCDYVVEHSRKVKNWWAGLKPLIEEFMKVNEIEDE